MGKLFTLISVIFIAWFYWPDFLGDDEIYSYEIWVPACHKSSCEYKNQYRSHFRIDKTKNQVIFKDGETGKVGRYYQCSIVDKENWVCPNSKSMFDGIINTNLTNPNALKLCAPNYHYIEKWKWQLIKLGANGKFFIEPCKTLPWEKSQKETLKSKDENATSSAGYINWLLPIMLWGAILWAIFRNSNSISRLKKVISDIIQRLLLIINR